MKTFLKVIAGILALLILLAVGLNFYFTDERLKEMAMPYIEDAVDRPVEIESMSLTFFSTFPRPGLSVENMVVPGETESDTLLSLNEMTASVELFSLMGDQIEVNEISLDQPYIQYKVYEDSTTNIDFLLQEESEADTSEGYSVNIPRFRITGGEVVYLDETSDMRADLQDISADISLLYGELIQNTLDLQIGGASVIVEGSEMIERLPLSLYQESTINMQEETVTLDEGTFSIRGLALNLTGTLAGWSTTPTVDLTFRSSSDDFGELLGLVPEEYEDQIRDLETSGSLAVDGTVTGAVGGEAVPDFNINIQIADGYLKYPEVPQPVENIQISAEANNKLITLEQFNAESGTNTLSGSGSLQEPLEEQRELTLEADLDFDLATIKDFYPIDEDTLAMRGELVGNVRMQGTADHLEQAVQSGSVQLSNGFIAHRDLAQPLEDITLEASLDGPVITVSTASFRTGENNLQVSGHVREYLSESRTIDLSITGNADLAQIGEFYDLAPAVTHLNGLADLNLRVRGVPAIPEELNLEGDMNVQDMNMEGESLVQPVNNLNGELTLSPSAATLTTLSFDLGSSDITLSGSLSNYMEYLKAEEDRSVTPHLEGSYQSKLLHMDELIEWDDTTSTATPIHLPDLTSEVRAEITELIITGVTMHNLNARAGTTPDQIELQEARVELFDGEASGSFLWEVPQPDHTAITFTGRLDSLQAGAFFEEYQVLGGNSRFHQFASGAFSADVDYSSELNEFLEPLMDSATMDGSFGMTQARLQDHPLQERLAEVFKANEFQNVALDQWKSTYQLKDHVLTIEDLSLTSDDIGLELNGNQHLTKGTIDYQMQLMLPGRFDDAIASVITREATKALTQDNGTIMVPLRVAGTHESPRLNPDKEVISPIVKEYLQDKAGNVLDRIFN